MRDGECLGPRTCQLSQKRNIQLSTARLFCWAGPVRSMVLLGICFGKKVRMQRQLGCDFGPREACSLIEEAYIKVIKCDIAQNM